MNARFALVAILVASASTAVWAADPQPTRPAIQVTMRDMAKISAHWQESIYATVWKDPALASIRSKLVPDGIQAPDVFSVVEMLSDMTAIDWRWLGMRLDSFGNPSNATSFCGDFGAYAEAVERQARSSWYTDLIEPRSIAGADSAVANRDEVLARFGSTVVAMPSRSTSIAPWKIPAHEGDLSVRIDLRAMLESARSISNGDALAQLDAGVRSLGPLLTTIDQRFEIVPEGILQRWRIDAAVPGLAPVEREVLARLPGNTLTVLAVGIDGRSLWAKGRKPVMEWINGGDPTGAKRAAQESEQAIDQRLTALHFDFSLSDLVTSFRGTVFVAFTPAAPVPAITLAFPRSRPCDALVDWFLTAMKQKVPAEGGQHPLVLPNVPVQLIAARDRGHWLITSDGALATSWLGGKVGGWQQSAAGALTLSKAAPGSCMLGSSDTPAVLRLASAFLKPVINASPGLDPADKVGISQALARLAELASPGYLVAGFDQGRLAGEARGVIGNLVIPALWTGVALGDADKKRASEVDAHDPLNDDPLK
ncbi:MAG: hypothetical protein H0V44_03760 [Planctomycetes bacterium]|nr:hypothetical protein [Planctomycetota bacterium]